VEEAVTTLTSDVIFTYTKGFCTHLARALNEIGGWPIHQVSQGAWGGVHWVVQIGPGLYLDVEGVRSGGDLLIRWEADSVGPTDDEDVWWRYRPEDLVIAGVVLEEAGMLTKERCDRINEMLPDDMSVAMSSEM
jgi:hypothetical protein